MKKYVSVLAMILTVFMLCSSLVGCDLLDTLKQNKEEANKQELFKDLKIEDTFEDGKPYHLYFISNGFIMILLQSNEKLLLYASLRSCSFV